MGTVAQQEALAELGFPTAADAAVEFRAAGRRGRIPWCDPRYATTLAYISAGAVLLVPISHCLLRGLIRSLFIYALTTPVSTVSSADAVVFNTAARERVQVCICCRGCDHARARWCTPCELVAADAVSPCAAPELLLDTPVQYHSMILQLLVQALSSRIVYPSAFNRPYRCAVKYIRSYVMEELANLIFIGCYVAQCGPPGFKTLWMRLQPAMWHYMYGKHDTVAQRHAAERSLKNYAARLEQYVLEGKVLQPAAGSFAYSCTKMYSALPG